MFGGAKKDWSNTGRGAFRAEINILLCGDPGTSKSQLLQYVYNLVPRSVVAFIDSYSKIYQKVLIGVPKQTNSDM